MQLTLQIDDALLREAARFGGRQTPQGLILEALREYIRQRNQQVRDTDQTSLAWSEWLAASEELSARILSRREGRLMDVDALLTAARDDLEERHDGFFGH